MPPATSSAIRPEAVAADSIWLALVLFPLLFLVVTAAGSRLLRWARVPTVSLLERLVFAAASGMGILSYALLAVGLMGAYHRTAFLLLLAACAALGSGELVRFAAGAALPRVLGARRSVLHRTKKQASGPAFDSAEHPAVTNALHCTPHAARRTAFLTWALVAIGALSAAMTLVGALAPPSGNDWDGLAYHLAAPKVYLRHGSIHFIPYDSHTNFPFTLEMLYGLGLSLAGTPLASLFHWVCALLAAVAVAAFLATHFGVGARAEGTAAKTALPGWAPPLAGAFVLTVPQVAWEATTAYIDLGTTLYQFLALYAVFNAVCGAPRPAPDTDGDGVGQGAFSWWVVAGAMSGWAMGTKMTAMLPFGMLVAAAGLWALLRRRRAWRGVLALAVVGVAVASPWYVKSWIWTNNPVYPFFYRLFPNSVNWTKEMDEAYRKEQAEYFGLGRAPRQFLMAPWTTAMDGSAFFTVRTREAREGRRPRDIAEAWGGDVRGSLGVALLGLAPLLPFARRHDWRVYWALAYIGGSYLSWFFLTQQSRYLLPIVAPAGAIGALVLAWLPHGFLRAAAGCFAAAVLLINMTVVYQWIYEPTRRVVFGAESRDAYLRRTLPELYPALSFVNRLPPESRVAFFQEVRGFYADREYFWANPLQHNLIPYEQFEDGAAMARFLRERLGITHALVNDLLARGSEETLWYRLLQDAARRGALRLLYDVNGVRIFEVR